MEPSLRVLVLIAQTQAGMWRRNGYSLLNQVRVQPVLLSYACKTSCPVVHLFNFDKFQIHFYHNVRFTSEMFDRDILMIQVGICSNVRRRILVPSPGLLGVDPLGFHHHLVTSGRGGDVGSESFSDPSAAQVWSSQLDQVQKKQMRRRLFFLNNHGVSVERNPFS